MSREGRSGQILRGKTSPGGSETTITSPCALLILSITVQWQLLSVGFPFSQYFHDHKCDEKAVDLQNQTLLLVALHLYELNAFIQL